MAGKLNILEIVDSHFVLHFLAPGEQDVLPVEAQALSSEAAGNAGIAPSQGSVGEGDRSLARNEEASDSSSAGGAAAQDPLPENLADDLVDEITDMIDDVSEDYAGWTGWERPLIHGFVDGVLAVADGSWSTLEDSYYEHMDNPDFSTIDAAIDEIAATFEGERPWDEAAKGFVRSAAENAEDAAAELEKPFWRVCAHGFFYGADAAYDLDWKVILTPAGNVLLTDEDSIEEAALARLEASGSGSFMDRVFNMIGIDPDELAAALAEEEDEAL